MKKLKRWFLFIKQLPYFMRMNWKSTNEAIWVVKGYVFTDPFQAKMFDEMTTALYSQMPKVSQDIQESGKATVNNNDEESVLKQRQKVVN